MDDFPGLLAKDFGVKPQGKSAPMAPPKNPSSGSNYGFGSDFTRSSYGNSKSSSNSIFDDDGYRGQPKYSSESRATSAQTPSFDYDSFFKDPKPPITRSPLFFFLYVCSDLGLVGNLVAKGIGQIGDVVRTADIVLHPMGRSTSESNRSQKLASNSSKTGSNLMENPFVVLEPKPDPADLSTGLFADPPGVTSKLNGFGKSGVESSSGSGGVFDDIDPLDGLGKSVPLGSSEINKRGKDRSPLSTDSGQEAPVTKEQNHRDYENCRKKRMPSMDNFLDSHQPMFDMPKIPLFTQPTSAPPPSRPPPSRPPRVSKTTAGSFSSTNAKMKVDDFSSFQNSTQYSQRSSQSTRAAANCSVTSQIDELEEFAMGRAWNNVEQAEGFPVDDFETDPVFDGQNRGGPEVAKRTSVGSSSSMKKASSTTNIVDDLSSIFGQKHWLRKINVTFKCKGNKLRDIQAVERATREARERAAAEARARAERVAVEKAAAEARERAERAAVQRAQTEARERAAAEARERAERAAAEAREREARESETRERVASAKAEAEARRREERAAVERAAAEARERAAAEARQRAAASASASQQNNDNDLESFFSMGSRPSSAPRPRANISAASSSGEFQEVEGETEERRRARLERHQRTQERARISETLDVEIKRWAAGKEGNLRALLSTMQYVLWPECGWQPVSLTDLITAAAVKKAYRKATLCIHPDKVQQKGANLQQKYISEKVFDLLKEAWNKFNSEELF
ncbi:hypothetical protein GOBAR_AA16693 [Gossypium barbadense]|uniref:J domain-containing protein n=1 Tax=Gossypium barbadense TaxID=3634 RepID=A0A2P5XKU6_GOSBA|nr:hypothetical protein GOBAR_AA16693 [Gossypium barbadense]